ncbi:MAG: hypothetical protein LAT81_12310 [Oceanicaulis sp.]|nr:hypothetical protein [Oceanicaulis sp.]
MKRRQLILFAVAGVLAVLVALDYARQWRPGEAEAPAAAARTETAQAIPSGEAGPFLPDFDAFAVIDERPLFTQTRRPPPRRLTEPAAPVQASHTDSEARPTFLISGVISGPDGLAVVLVREGGESRRIYAGETFNGWRIDSVNTDSVIVTRGNSRWRLPVGQDG